MSHPSFCPAFIDTHNNPALVACCIVAVATLTLSTIPLLSRGEALAERRGHWPRNDWMVWG